ncbi:hypothetical protein C8J56DRAFT_476351 [Mycena floridula]|nr:hypothetical protein C8J56DRAFT_476351 [Mycena floridula]
MSNLWFEESSSSTSSTPSPIEREPSARTPGTQHVLRTIVKGRKSWKTLRGGEIVWPPELEAALLEGLESYQPDDSRETRLLGRFPLRNRFISDFIYQKTGKTRSPKQVGSRLQQLRDTCGGKQLLNLLCPSWRPGVQPSNQIYRSSPRYEGSGSDTSGPTSPTSSTELDLPGPASRLSPAVIYIDILPREEGQRSSSSSSGRSSGHSSPECSPATLDSFPGTPRRLECIDPTIVLLSRTPIQATSSSTVLCDGSVVHTDLTALELKQISSQAPETLSGAYLYASRLAPRFWNTLCQCPDPTRFEIRQEVKLDDDTVAYSALFKFSCTKSPTSSSFPAQVHSYPDEDAYHDIKMGNYYAFDGEPWIIGGVTPGSDSGYDGGFDETHFHSR